ncbi:MAG: tRNA (adenosine(37)-N6)-threonylcarbamoyltransferase complex dimerization subunit type 1 TsaB [Balneolaceae bacterium]|nr:MAG: tRNA (adenosine(37)-N6)-threonylcarbamoyltransferase complex dimerization subunit type 1 TsaB [Balneolaceae bacterium]
MILAIETSTPVCSVALGKRGSVIEKRIEGRGVHSEHTFLFINELLQRYNLSVDDLDAVLFSNGPGSYTGLRIGAAAIKGLLFGRNVPLFTLSTLVSFSMAKCTKPGSIVHAVIDARRQHLYHQKIVMEGSGELTISEPVVKELAKLEAEIKPGEILIGTGWDRLQIENPDKVEKAGSEAVSAKNLIHAWNNSAFKAFFREQSVEGFEPDYLTMAQINNSALGK